MPDAHDVTVWLSSTADAVDESVLSSDDVAAAARYRFEEDRRRYRVSHARLRHILASATGLDPRALVFHTNDHGKPYLEGGGVEFNLSHSGDVIAIAVASDPVGIDVEQIRESLEPLEIAERFFRPEEVAWLASRPAEQLRPAFFRMWTLKEAVIKADGRGLTMGLGSITVIPRDTGITAVELHAPDAPRDWIGYELDVRDGYRGAVVTRGQRRVTVIR